LGNSSILDITGTASINSGTELELLFSGYKAGSYHLMHPAGGITGTYASVTNLNTARYSLNYTTNDIYTLINGASSGNARAVATQLDNLTNPTSGQLELLNNLYALSNSALNEALIELSGEPYANLMQGVENVGFNYIRTLYAPIRQYATNYCGLKKCSSDFWYEASAEGSNFCGDNHAKSFNNAGFNVAIGATSPAAGNLLLGASLFYEYDHYHFNHEGNSEQNSVFVGAYSLYRPKAYYILGDLMAGYSHGDVSRKATVNSLTYKDYASPSAYIAALYVEAGKDFLINQFLLQPFLGLNVGSYSWKKFNERGNQTTAHYAVNRNYAGVYSRLGVHLTRLTSCMDFTLGLDLDWAYRLTKRNNHRTVAFSDFGNQYTVEGTDIAPSSLEASLYANRQLNKAWMLYLEAGTQVWKNAVNGSLSAGVTYSF
jgi:uncharacterized protein with beta-barrel porin domain